MFDFVGVTDFHGDDDGDIVREPGEPPYGPATPRTLLTLDVGRSGTDRNLVIHLCTEDQARREACSARDRAGQPVGATHASPLRISS